MTDMIATIVARATMIAYPELLPQLTAELAEHGLRPVLMMTESEHGVDEALLDAMTMQVRGIVAAARPREDVIARLRSDGPPLLLYNCAAPEIDSVSCDHEACGRTLARALLDGGHRRFGLIASPEDSLVGVERIRGAVSLLRSDKALAIEIEPGDYTYDSGYAAVDALFSRMKPKPSAIIAANDAMAMGALDRARELRIRIPRDLSIVGIDGTAAAQLPGYRITTVTQPVDRMSAVAVETLLARLADPAREAEARLFAGALQVGDTARLVRPRRAADA
ncbi:hypothetical protein DMC47_34480 [Nostoc sp. 3335mG]|nr:hypothetical protein DMC47_34480 [Nostoc sp. 3335mG]